ncbi:hypothetical protein CYD94_02145 [Ralstonia solanacearum]|nr:hypothetical protein CYD94_02145 [Ralstonia solanacearum]
MLAILFSPLHAAAGRFVTCALAHFNPSAGVRAKARYSAHVALRDCVLPVAGRGAGGDVLAVSPVPPSRDGRPGAFGGALEARGPHRFFQWGITGSADNPWKSALGCAKSLFPQENTPTGCRCFSTGCPVFSTGRVSVVRRAAPSFSLSKSLKEKKKEQGGRQAGRAQDDPRVEGVFPRVPAPAYFLVHGFHRSERANPWKSVEEKFFLNKGLGAAGCSSTDPQVALPVLPPCARKRGPA